MGTIVGNENLRTLWDGLAAQCGSREFMHFFDHDGREEAYTYAQFNGLINQTANYFLELGVQPGENVAVQLYNSPEFISALFGLAKIGATAVPMNMAHKREECAFMYDRCHVRKVVTEPDFQEFYRGEGALDVDIVCVAHAQLGALDAGSRDFDAEVARQSADLAYMCAIDPLDTAVIMFTSGTTSMPKGVMLTHANLLYGGMYGNWEFAMTPQDRFFTTMPAFHSNFLLSALMPVLTTGAVLVFADKYSARRFWKEVRQAKATIVQSVAMIARTMMLQPVDEHERDHCVRTVQYYLAISDEEMRAFEARFNVRLQNCYGSTESICWALTDVAYGGGMWPSVGRVGLGYEAYILDENGAEVSDGSVGEIVIKGIPGISLMKGYYNDPDATAKAMRPDGRLFTGDKGYRDASGWYYFVDRKSNMIKRAGENVSASEVEEVLMAHPSIAEAAVIGVDDPIRDQAVKAFVVFAPGKVETIEDLTAFCNDRLSDFKVPTIMEILDELPHTSVGKVAKKMLK